MNGQEKYPPIHINVPSACSTATGTTLAFALAFAQCLASALAVPTEKTTNSAIR